MNDCPRNLLPTGLAALGLALCASACGSDDEDGPMPDPRAFFAGAASAALGAPTNRADCATCHADSRPPSAGNSGDSLVDIAFRSSWKGGGASTLLDATNACVTGWMGGPALAEGSAAWASLRAYLESISSPSVTTPNTLAPEVLANEAAYEAAYAGGNATAGAAAYATYCARCHDRGLVLGGSFSVPRAQLKAAYSPGRIAQKVRTSGPPPSGTADATDSTPGPMPFFEPDELSPTDLANIIAFIES